MVRVRYEFLLGRTNEPVQPGMKRSTVMRMRRERQQRAARGCGIVLALFPIPSSKQHVHSQRIVSLISDRRLIGETE